MGPKENITISKNQNNTEKPLNNKWEKHLDDYTNYTQEYIRHYKKALLGDTISSSIYPYLKVRSEALYEQLSNAREKSLLTEKQIKKMSEIQTEDTVLTNKSI